MKASQRYKLPVKNYNFALHRQKVFEIHALRAVIVLKKCVCIDLVVRRMRHDTPSCRFVEYRSKAGAFPSQSEYHNNTHAAACKRRTSRQTAPKSAWRHARSMVDLPPTFPMSRRVFPKFTPLHPYPCHAWRNLWTSPYHACVSRPESVLRARFMWTWSGQRPRPPRCGIRSLRAKGWLIRRED